MAKVYGWEQGHETLTMSRSGFLTLMQELLAFADFDEDWYLTTYKDVADAVAQGSSRRRAIIISTTGISRGGCRTPRVLMPASMPGNTPTSCGP
jgi:hypothetical protein